MNACDSVGENAPDTSVKREVALESIKEDVNNFLWSKLPGAITLAEADVAASKIVDIIEAAWDEKEKP